MKAKRSELLSLIDESRHYWGEWLSMDEIKSTVEHIHSHFKKVFGDSYSGPHDIIFGALQCNAFVDDGYIIAFLETCGVEIDEG